MAGARFESPVGRSNKRPDIEINEQVLVLPCTDVPQCLFDPAHTLLKRVEVAGGQSLGMVQDIHRPLNDARLQPLFGEILAGTDAKPERGWRTIELIKAGQWEITSAYSSLTFSRAGMSTS